MFQDEPEKKEEDPTHELEPRSLHLGPVFLEMGAASLLGGNLEVATPESWEVLGAGSPPLSWPASAWEGVGQVLVLAENLPEALPESAGPRAGPLAVVLARPSRASDVTAAGWAPAAPALSLIPWYNSRPSLPGPSFPWHRAGSWCMLKE